MSNYLIAGIPIRLDLVHTEYFGDGLNAYRIADETPVRYRIEVLVTDEFKIPSTKPKIVFGSRSLYQLKHESQLVVGSEDGSYVKQTVTTSEDFTFTEIRLNPRYGARLPEIEYLATGMIFFDIAAREGLLAMHAAAIANQNAAILFAAPSRVGKSTHAELWKTYGTDIRVINDDKPLISLENGIPTVHGSPWSGKKAENENVSYPLQAIVFLKQSLINTVVEIDDTERLTQLMRNSYRPHDEILSGKMLDVIDAILRKTDILEFRTDISEAAFKMIRHRIEEGRPLCTSNPDTC